MKSIPIPETLTVYALVKQTGLTFNIAGYSSSTPSIGFGFYMSMQEAEHHRTLEILKDETNSMYHVFPLEVPNPAFKK